MHLGYMILLSMQDLSFQCTLPGYKYPFFLADQQYPEWRKHIIKAKKTAWATVGTVVKLQVRLSCMDALRSIGWGNP